MGHVMRMEESRATKAVTLGWMEELEITGKTKRRKRKTVRYWIRLVKEAGVDWTEMDTVATDRKRWKEVVTKRMERTPGDL